MCVRLRCFLVTLADWSHRSQLLGCGGCVLRLRGCMCVYILFRKFLSLFRHFLRIGCWQDVGCEVLQAVRVGTVKNLSSQYICTHALQGVDAHPSAGFGSTRYDGFNYGGCACRL